MWLKSIQSQNSKWEHSKMSDSDVLHSANNNYVCVLKTAFERKIILQTVALITNIQIHTTEGTERGLGRKNDINKLYNTPHWVYTTVIGRLSFARRVITLITQMIFFLHSTSYLKIWSLKNESKQTQRNANTCRMPVITLVMMIVIFFLFLTQNCRNSKCWDKCSTHWIVFLLNSAQAKMFVFGRFQTIFK